MRFSTSNFVAAATAAGALLLAACAGHGVVPAANSFAPSAFSPDAIAPDTKKATPSPCTKKQTPWVFGGTCATVTLTSTGGTAKMSGYQGFGIQAAFSTGAKAGTVLMVRDAVGKGGDAAGKVKGAFFPHFTKFGLPQSLTTVTPVLYLKVQNLGAAFNFSSIPAIQVTSKAAYPGNQCVETRMNPTNNTWQEYPTNLGKPAGHLVKFPAITQTIQFPKGGTIYIAVACYTKKS
jgi:hypothetical protein